MHTDTDDKTERDEEIDAAHVTFGAGPELSEEEIKAANEIKACATCGIIHPSRPCTKG